jgi:hypothetical protein
MNPLEAELRAFGVNLTPEQWERYRQWAAKNPHGGMAGHQVKREKRVEGSTSVANPVSGENMPGKPEMRVTALETQKKGK